MNNRSYDKSADRQRWPASCACLALILSALAGDEAVATVFEKTSLQKLVSGAGAIVLATIDESKKIESSPGGGHCGYVYSAAVEDQFTGKVRSDLEFVTFARLTVGQRYLIFAPTDQEAARRRHDRVKCSNQGCSRNYDNLLTVSEGLPTEILEEDDLVSQQSNDSWYRVPLQEISFPTDVPIGKVSIALSPEINVQEGGLRVASYEIVQLSALKAAIQRLADKR